MAAKKTTKASVKSKSKRPATASGQHARAKEPLKKDDRIQHIVTMMVSGMWVTGQSAPMLAEEWGLAKGTVENDAAEASRYIKLAFSDQDKEELRAKFMGKLEGVLRSALLAKRYEAAKGLLELEGKVCGHFEPEKVEISGNLSDLLELGLTPSGEEAS